MTPEQIRIARIARRLSRLRLAVLAGVHEEMVRKVEQGIAVPEDSLLAIVSTLELLASQKVLRKGGAMHGLIDALSPPAGPGWYATLYCWDQDEGIFAGATWWSGSQWKWLPKHPGCPPTIAYHPRRHASRKQAAEAADLLDL